MANPELIKKGKETTDKLLNWLYIFKYSKSVILQQITGLTPAGIGSALKNLEKRGLVISLKPNPPLKTVWGITWDGICEIGELDEYQKFEPSKFNELTATHHYNLQSLKLLLEKKGLNLIPIKRASIGASEKAPDAIVKNDDKVIAIELERTVKSKSRYKAIWGGYVQDIRAGKYSSTQYFLPNKRTQNLPKIFEQMQTVIIQGKSVEFNETLKQYFKFTDISDKI
jgi:hypothetical protein